MQYEHDKAKLQNYEKRKQSYSTMLPGAAKEPTTQVLFKKVRQLPNVPFTVCGGKKVSFAPPLPYL